MSADRKAVSLIILNELHDSLYMQERSGEESYSGAVMFAGGGIEPEDERPTEDETHNAAALREGEEELGIDILATLKIETPRQALSPSGTQLFPRLVVGYIGELPEKTLDKQSPLRWVKFDEALISKYESVRVMTEGVTNYLNFSEQSQHPQGPQAI